MDVASVDVIWNGFAQSLKIAALAETHEVACAPHNYYSHLATFIAAQWCAAIPNVRLLEIDVDDVPWREELTTAVPEIRDGELVVPGGPGLGLRRREDVLARTRGRVASGRSRVRAQPAHERRGRRWWRSPSWRPANFPSSYTTVYGIQRRCPVRQSQRELLARVPRAGAPERGPRRVALDVRRAPPTRPSRRTAGTPTATVYACEWRTAARGS